MTQTLALRTDPPGNVRLFASGATILATLPYLTLKFAWLTGSTIGVTDPAFIGDPAVHGLNVLTAGMDVAAIVIAVALVVPFGRRVPAWLLLLPAWVASGLLGPIALTTVPALLASSGGSDSSLPLESWVTPIVYGGFTIQGIGLIVGFVFYGVDRWGDAVRDLTAPVRTALRDLVLPATVAAVASGAIGVVSTLSIAGVGRALFSFAAAAGVWTLTHSAAPGRRAIAAAWLGSGAMFAWGLWGLLVVLTDAPLGDETPSAAANLYSLLQTITGLTVGLVSLAIASDRSQGTPGHV